VTGQIETVILVIFSCLITSGSRILLKRGVVLANALTGMVYSLVVGWLALLILFTLSISNERLSVRGLLFFAAIGLVAPPVVRYLTYIGVEKVGPSRSDPVRSLTPLFALLIAFFIFGEAFNSQALLAGIFIVIGIFMLSLDSWRNSTVQVFRFKDLIYPLAAAILAGLIANFRKLGMSLEISPLSAAFSSATSAMLVFFGFIMHRSRYRELVWNRASFKFFALSGLLVSITDIIDLVALRRLNVTMVAPLLAATPLFVIILSLIFLRDIERITLSLVAGAVLIFVGVALIVGLAHA